MVPREAHSHVEKKTVVFFYNGASTLVTNTQYLKSLFEIFVIYYERYVMVIL